MDNLTFFSKVIDSLAWPCLSVFLVLMFRDSLLELISTIRKVKLGSMEAEFEVAIKQVLDTAFIASAGSPDSITSFTNLNAEYATAKFVAARIEPTATIIEGWSTLGDELRKLGRQTGEVVNSLISQHKIIQIIMSSDVLPSETKEMIGELRRLRNQVAHAQVIPTSDSAQDYLIAVERVVELIHNYRKNLPGYTVDVR